MLPNVLRCLLECRCSALRVPGYDPKLSKTVADPPSHDLRILGSGVNMTKNVVLRVQHQETFDHVTLRKFEVADERNEVEGQLRFE